MSQIRCGYCEVVNSTLDTVFNNTSNNDMVFYTETSNQSIHFGTQTGAAPSALKVTRSNIEVNGDIALTRRVNLGGVLVKPRSTVGVSQNITSTVTSVPALASQLSNVTFSLSNPQSEFRFVNSNGVDIVGVTGQGQLVANGVVDSSNQPSYTWSNDRDTGMYHASNDTIGFTCGGTNVMSVMGSNVNITGVLSVSGYVKIPTGPIMFRARNPGTVNALISLKFATVHDNIGNYYDSVLGRFTAPVKGVYTFTTILNNGAASAWDVFMVKNGTSGSTSYTLGTTDSNCLAYGYETNNTTLTLTAIAPLNQGDYVYIASAYTIAYKPADSFMGALLYAMD